MPLIRRKRKRGVCVISHSISLYILYIGNEILKKKTINKIKNYENYLQSSSDDSPVDNGGGRLTTVQSQIYNNRIWAIFDGKSTTGKLDDDPNSDSDNIYQKTWEGARISTHFEKDGNWEAVSGREHCYRSNQQINGHIKVSNATLFNGWEANGLQFTLKNPNNVDGGGYYALELCPREYRVFMNCVADNDCSFAIDGVPNGYYIWIEALSANDNGVRFSLAGENGEKCTRIDGDGNDVVGKHMFCYQAQSNIGKLVIKPMRSDANGSSIAGACYIYYVAVMDHPIPIIRFDKGLTTNITLPSSTSPNNQASLYINGYSMDMNNSILQESFEYSSDDETVVTVDKTYGTIKAVGKGKATVTATLKAGFRYSVGNKVYTLERDCTASYEVTVNDNRVVSSTIQDGSNKKLWEAVSLSDNYNEYVKLYFGGWKYQSGSALAPYSNSYYNIFDKTIETYKYGDGTERQDFWDKAKKYSVGYELPVDYQAEPIDGYNFYNLGKENGKSEFLYSDRLLAGDYVLDFKEREGERKESGVLQDGTPSADKTNGKGNPFTVPCFGSFLKIEPQRNGQMTVYILQNGNLEFNSDKNNHLIGRIGWRPVYIVDEAGNRLTTTEDNVKAVTKQRTMVSYNDETADVYDTDDNLIYTDSRGNFKSFPDGKIESGYTPATYIDAIKAYRDPTTDEPMYEDYEEFYTKYWRRRGNPEVVLDPDVTGDGWVVMTKAYVKYQFDVKAGKSYYVFANKSAIGFCGASFLPYDASTSIYNLYEDGTVDKTLETALKSGSVTANQVKVYHKFHQGWNSICLPFSITESKMREIFGSKTISSGDLHDQKKEDYELVMYNGATFDEKDPNYDKVHFFHHVYQDIVAGYPYMLYIPSGASVLKTGNNGYPGYFTVNNVTIENVNRPTITTSRQYMPDDSGFEDHAENSHFTFTGVYDPTTIVKGSYCVVSTGIQMYESVKLPGYRAYLRPTYKDDPAYMNEIRRITSTNLNELSYIWDEANPIESVFAEDAPENGLAAPSNVYSVSGQLVRQNSTSFDGLPKGVYIVDGKKYFVK